MKLRNLIYMGALLFVLASCSDDDPKAILDIGDSFQITSPDDGTKVEYTADDLEAVATTYSYTKADFGFSAATVYQLQLDLQGGDFSAPITVGASTATDLPITVGDLNNGVLGLGFPAENPAVIDTRVIARISENIDSIVSDVISIEVTPFQVQYPFLHVPGAYQGWNPADSSTIIYSLGRNGIYDGYIYFEEVSEFKFTDGPSWDSNYGDTGNDGVLDPNGDNMSTTVPGMHRLRVDLNTLLYSAEVTNWGVIGDATPTGWDSDTDMIYDSGSGTLKATMDLVQGELKFRANDDWALNYGDTDANSSLEEGGDNIKIDEDGNYTIELILNTPVFTYKITKN